MSPKAFGGMGGVTGGRGRDSDDEFENAVDRALGDLLRVQSVADAQIQGRSSLASRLWGSLANVEWQHTNGNTAGYSFRAAGDLIAAVIGEGDYMDWYCSAPDGIIDSEIEIRMMEEGWSPIRE